LYCSYSFLPLNSPVDGKESHNFAGNVVQLLRPMFGSNETDSTSQPGYKLGSCKPTSQRPTKAAQDVFFEPRQDFALTPSSTFS
jgi:hypothetical protein